jgi:REP element-mobilizing transposase RayT
MPRSRRLDASGLLHHIMVRPVERRNIFKDDTDREGFLARLARPVPETQMASYARAPMSNHVLLHLRTDPAPLPILMRCLSGVDATRCPICRQGRLRVVGLWRPGAIPATNVFSSLPSPRAVKRS